MAVTETTPVKSVVLSGNPIVSIVHSNNYTTGTNGYAMDILVFTVQPSAGQYFTISLLNGAYEITFVAASSPDDSGKQFPSGAGAPDSTYLNSVKTWLEKNFIIASYYDISVVGSANIVFSANQYGEDYNVELLYNDFSATYSGLGSGSITELKENFAIHGKLKVYEGSDWEEVIEDRLVPNASGNVEFNWQEVIDVYIKNLKDGTLNMQYPDSGAVSFILERPNLIRRFAFSFAEFYGVPYEPESIKVESDAWYSIEGGFSKMFQAYLNANSSSFYDRLVSKRHFLTWSHNGKKVHENQMDRLFFLNLNATSVILVRITVRFSDGTGTYAYVTSLSGTGMFKVYEIATSPWLVINHFAASIPAGERISSYTVTLVNPYYAGISESFEFVIDYEDYEALRFFMFKNSFGVFETIYTVGTGIKNTSYKRTPVEKILDFDFTNLDHEHTDNQVIEGENYNVNTGFFDSINKLERFRDFLISEHVYEIIDGFLAPIQLLSNKAMIREDKRYNYALEFEYRRAYESEYYSVDEFNKTITAKTFFSDSGTVPFSDKGSAKLLKK